MNFCENAPSFRNFWSRPRTTRSQPGYRQGPFKKKRMLRCCCMPKLVAHHIGVVEVPVREGVRRRSNALTCVAIHKTGSPVESMFKAGYAVHDAAHCQKMKSTSASVRAQGLGKAKATNNRLHERG